MSIKVIVIGGGAAGMMAAVQASEKGAQVTLIEKNKNLGKKILITGKGRCNLTNSIDIEGMISNFPGNGTFLYGALYTFSNSDLMNFFTELGVPLKIERGGRVFPKSDRSYDIVGALEKKLKKNNVSILTNSEVIEIYNKSGKFMVILKDGHKIIGDKLIIATGGVSYPVTGSTGDGYKWAKIFGHEIVPIRPSLVPLVAKEKWIRDLQGLSLKNVNINLTNKNNKKLAEGFGEMLFTHFGVSGPIILTISRVIVDDLQKNKKHITLHIDFKPALSWEQLDNRVQRDIKQFSNKQLKNSLGQLLPNKLIPVVIERANLDPTKVMHQITKEERKNLVNLLKDFTLTITGARPIEEAIVTAGGVNVKEINPQTMESKLIPNLYFVGEILDIDGVTGGFNLQAAFSTGFVAGASAGVL